MISLKGLTDLNLNELMILFYVVNSYNKINIEKKPFSAFESLLENLFSFSQKVYIDYEISPHHVLIDVEFFLKRKLKFFSAFSFFELELFFSFPTQHVKISFTQRFLPVLVKQKNPFEFTFTKIKKELGIYENINDSDLIDDVFYKIKKELAPFYNLSLEKNNDVLKFSYTEKVLTKFKYKRGLI